jgi:chaperonin GroES
MTIEPTSSRVLVDPMPDESVTPGGIFIPDVAQKKPTKGTVLAIGPDVKGAAIGDLVLYPQFAGHDIEGVRILEENDLIGKLVDG